MKRSEMVNFIKIALKEYNKKPRIFSPNFDTIYAGSLLEGIEALGMLPPYQVDSKGKPKIAKEGFEDWYIREWDLEEDLCEE